LVLREHTSEDYPALRELWGRAGDAGALGLSAADEPDPVAAFLGRNPGLSLGLWEDDRLIGSVLAGHDGRRGFLYHAAVRPDRRGRGYGSLLVEEALAGLAAAGVRKVHVMVYAANDEGRRFWRHVGFAPRDELVVLSREIETAAGRPSS
jgi:ribosomal protein S18 acetylase RimI-like enzyme